MKYIKKLRLNTILKLSLVALAVSGIYYFVTAAQSKNNSKQQSAQVNHQPSLSPADELVMKQKCQQAGETYIQKNLSSFISGSPTFIGGLALQYQTYAYNKTLNTCLVSYQLWGSGSGIMGDKNDTGWRTQYYIEDTLTEQRVAEFFDGSQMKPQQQSYGYNTQDPKCSTVQNIKLCFSNKDEYLNSTSFLMN